MGRMVRTIMPLLLLMCVACGDNKQPQASSGARPSSSATIAIAKPAADDVIDTKTFEVEIDLDGGKIVKIVSQDLTANEGHVHVSIDGKIQSQTFGLSDKLKTPEKGSHLLQAEFVAKDHGPFDPRVLSSVAFTVE